MDERGWQDMAEALANMCPTCGRSAADEAEEMAKAIAAERERIVQKFIVWAADFATAIRKGDG